VRLMKNIGDLNAFIRFTQLCAGRIGQLLNHTALAGDAGISPNTAKAWLSLLESSFLVYRLQPYHRNFTKRLVKTPKLYFYDTGLACSLLGIRDHNQVGMHYLRGALFENLVINEFIKHTAHRGEYGRPYFWQDSQGKEIDCVLIEGENVTPVEIKSGRTLELSYLANLAYWRKLTGGAGQEGYAVYGGEQSMQTGSGTLLSWRHLGRITPGEG